MGRWAQQHRRGGGPAATAAPITPITINQALSSGGADVIVSFIFSAPITAADFAPGDFGYDPGTGEVFGLSIVQGAPDDLEVTFAVLTDAGNSWSYSGSAPNVTTPESGITT